MSTTDKGNSIISLYKRRHISRNFNVESPSTHYHPETIARMVDKGLTREDMMAANNHYHWMRMRAIRKVYKYLLTVRVGYISIREIAREAHADPKTVKQALALTDEEIALQLKVASLDRRLTVAKEINIIEITSLENLKAERKMEQTTSKAIAKSKTLAEMQQKWFARGESGGSPRVPTAFAGDGERLRRRQEDEAYARAYMLELEAEKRKRRGPEGSVLMNKVEMKAYLARKNSPGRFKEVEAHLKRKIGWKKENYGKEKENCRKEECLHAGKSRETTNGPTNGEQTQKRTGNDKNPGGLQTPSAGAYRVYRSAGSG